MTWFKVDDGFHSHPKVLRAGNAAVGLYVRCGSYSSDHLTNGHIPDAIAKLYGTEPQVNALLRERLWVTVPGGYLMPDFLEFNPSAEKVLAQRAAGAERQRAARERALSRRDSRVSHSEVTRESQRESRRESHDPDPTRPDPTPSSLTQERSLTVVVGELGDKLRMGNA
jgi:hypothetical protein